MNDNETVERDEREIFREARQMGFDQYEGSEIARQTDNLDELDPMLEIPPTDSARWANRTAPKLRSIAGYGDRGCGTVQVDREVDLERDGETITVMSSHIYDKLVDTYREGCLDSICGNNRTGGRLG